MVKRTGPTNYQVQLLLQDIKPQTVENRFWKRIIKDITKPARQRRVANLYKISKFAKEGETIVVPGKVLSVGEIDKKINVAALSFSAAAKKKIIDANGKVLTIKELLESNPDGKKVRIIG